MNLPAVAFMYWLHALSRSISSVCVCVLGRSAHNWVIAGWYIPLSQMFEVHNAVVHEKRLFTGQNVQNGFETNLPCGS